MDIEIPGYTLLRTLGKGGMATVYLARQDVLERRIALKIMSRSLAEDPTFGARFMREAKIVSQLVHPNIVTVHEVGQHEGRYYLSMEHIDGHDLRVVRKKLDLQGKVRVVEDIARALHYAGEKGYVHRDIKPENIMFRSTDGSAVLTDFGIAKAVKTDLSVTQTGTAIGTPHYMSPEQAKGKSVDHRSDLYSLGVVFYLLLTGRVPYDADTAIAIGIKHLTESIPRLPVEYAEMQFVLDGLMAKDPDDRYQSGIQLLNDLRRIDLYEIENNIIPVDDNPTLAADLPTRISSANDNVEEANSRRFTLEFEAIEVPEKPPRSILPSVIASLFIVLAISFFVYMARPEWAEPYIAGAEKIGGEYGSKLGEAVDKSSSEINQKLEEAKQDLSEADGSMEAEAMEPEAIESATTESAAKEPNDIVDSKSQLASEISEQSSAIKSSAIKSQEQALATQAPEGPTDVLQASQKIAEEVSEVSTEEEALPELALPSLERLLEKKGGLEAGVNDSTEQVQAYIDAHTELLSHYPDHKETQNSLVSLKGEFVSKIRSAAREGKREQANRYLNDYGNLFSSVQDSSEFDQLSSDTALTLQVNTLHQKADQLIKSGQITEPEQENAITVLQSILKLVDDEQAKQKLAAISDQLVERSNKHLNARETERARRAADWAARATPNKLTAVQQLAAVRTAILQQERTEKALADGKKYAALGYLYSPGGANAYDAFNRALTADPDNLEASEGIAQLIDKLSAKVWGLVGEAKFDEAKSALIRPLILMPNNERLQSMNQAVDDVINNQAEVSEQAEANSAAQ